VSGYVQGYNCHAAVDAGHQVIVAQDVIARQNDGGELVPLVDQMESHPGGHRHEVSADTGCCSEENIKAL